MNHKPSIKYNITGVPPCVEVHRHHPLWGYVCPLLLEEYDWFHNLKASSPYGHLLQRYWPECIDMFFGWLDNHPEYLEEYSINHEPSTINPHVIHGVNSARRAFETFCHPDSGSGQALRITLECWAEKEHHQPMLIGDIIPPHILSCPQLSPSL